MTPLQVQSLYSCSRDQVRCCGNNTQHKKTIWASHLWTGQLALSLSYCKSLISLFPSHSVFFRPPYIHPKTVDRFWWYFNLIYNGPVRRFQRRYILVTSHKAVRPFRFPHQLLITLSSEGQSGEHCLLPDYALGWETGNVFLYNNIWTEKCSWAFRALILPVRSIFHIFHSFNLIDSWRDCWVLKRV